MGFHCYTAASAAEPAAEGDGWCRWWFIGWSAPTNMHPQKGPTHLNVFSLPFSLSLSHTDTQRRAFFTSAFLTLTLIKAPAAAAARPAAP